MASQRTIGPKTKVVRSSLIKRAPATDPLYAAGYLSFTTKSPQPSTEPSTDRSGTSGNFKQSMTISIAHAPRFTRLVYAYEKHLKSKVPGSLLKNASFGGSPTHEELERMVLEALALGRPVPEWEAELEAIRRIPRDQRSLDELFDVPD